MNLTARLVPNPQKLGTVVVKGESIDPALSKLGFYKRKTFASGGFFLRMI